MIKFHAKGRCAVCTSDDVITTGSVGIPVEFHFDGYWDGCAKVAVFQGSGVTVDVALTGSSCTVPHEVLTEAGDMLIIGVYGTNGESGDAAIVIPTVYALAGRIHRGAEPSEIDPEPPTPALVDQILTAAQNAQDIAQSVRDDADNGVFDGTDGVSPTVAVTNITGGHRLTITDANGTTTVDVMDGEDGQDATVDATLSQSGEAADALITGRELTALTPVTDASAFSWSLGKTINDSGASRHNAAQAKSTSIAAPTGTRIQNRCAATIDVSGTAWPTILYVHEFNGATWLRRTYIDPGVGMTVGASTTHVLFTFGISVSSGLTMTQTIVDDNFGVRVIKPVPRKTSELANDSGFITSAPVSSVDGKTGAVTVMPPGGTTGQVLKKASATDFDVEWGAGGGGGSVTIDDTLTQQGQAADAKAAGDAIAAKYTKPGTGIPKTDLAAAVQTSLGKADTALQSYTETDPTVPSWAKASSKPSYTASEVGAIAAPASPTSGDVLTYDGSAWGASAPSHQIPAGGNAGECLAKNSSSDYDLRWRTINDWTPAGLVRTAGGTAAKVAEWSLWSATQYPAWLVVTVGNSNTYAGAITLKVNGSTAYPIYINGVASSATNYTLPAGSYLVYFDGTNMYFRTDGIIPGTEPKEVTISTAGAVTQALDAGKLYHFTGALTSLTITLNAAGTGIIPQYHFDFDSGSTAPTVMLPGTATMQGGTFTPEANKHYEVDILNGYGVSLAW